MSRLLYLDSSAIVKTIIAEAETPALLATLADWPDRVSSALARVEVPRALRRAGAPAAVFRRAEETLRRLLLIWLDDDVLEVAAGLDPESLRTLDAIHLATALSVRSDLQAVVTYDLRFARAAVHARLLVWAPGSAEELRRQVK